MSADNFGRMLQTKYYQDYLKFWQFTYFKATYRVANNFSTLLYVNKAGTFSNCRRIKNKLPLHLQQELWLTRQQFYLKIGTHAAAADGLQSRSRVRRIKLVIDHLVC